MMSLRDKEGGLYGTKQEEDESNKASIAASSSSRQWSSGLKNPRIVRVSRSFGGKDRHSKVCTIKGLRDRRIRLSVPTAIQLYDLQDRLGLNQPSKVIDWLIDNTKHDIDKLPPLPAIPGSFTPFHQPSHASQEYGTHLSSSTPFFDSSLLQSRRESININSQQSVDVDEDESLVAKLKYWDSQAMMRSKQKEVDAQGGVGETSTPNSQISAQNFFPIASGNNTSMLPPSSLLSNHPMFNYYHWEPSNLSLSQLGGLGLSSQNENHHHHHHHHQSPLGNSSQLPPPLALSSGSQFFLSPSMASSSLFPPHASYLNNHHQVEDDTRQFNRFHLSNPFSSALHASSSGLGLRPFPLSMSHQPHLQQSDEDRQDKHDHSHWKESSRN